MELARNLYPQFAERIAPLATLSFAVHGTRRSRLHLVFASGKNAPESSTYFTGRPDALTMHWSVDMEENDRPRLCAQWS